MIKNYMGSVRTHTVVKGSEDMHSLDILPSCKKVVVTNLSTTGASAANILKIEASPLSDYAIVTKGGSANATVVTRVANTFMVNSSNLYEVGATGVAVGTNKVTITTTNALPANLVGAPIRIIYSASDPLERELPSMMYISAISGTSVTVELDKVSTWASASVASSGIEILSSKRLKKNLPAFITSVTVSGDKATFHGSFPAKEIMNGATIDIHNDSAFLTATYRSKGDSLRFVIENYDESAGTFSVKEAKGKLVSMSAGTGLESCSIDREAGFGTYFANEEAYYNQGMNMLSISSAGIAPGDELLIEQYLG